MGTFLMLWAVFTTFMIVPCITRIAGYTGLIVGVLGLYGCFASVVNATWRRSIIPLGSRDA